MKQSVVFAVGGIAVVAVLFFVLSGGGGSSDVAKELNKLPASSEGVMAIDLESFLNDDSLAQIRELAGKASSGSSEKQFPFDTVNLLNFKHIVAAKLPDGSGVIVSGDFKAAEVVETLAKHYGFEKGDGGLFVSKKSADNLAMQAAGERAIVFGEKVAVPVFVAAYTGQAARLEKGPIVDLLAKVETGAAWVGAASMKTGQEGAFSVRFGGDVVFTVFAKGLPKEQLDKAVEKLPQVQAQLGMISPQMIKGLASKQVSMGDIPKGFDVDGLIALALDLAKAAKLERQGPTAVRATTQASLPKDGGAMVAGLLGAAVAYMMFQTGPPGR